MPTPEETAREEAAVQHILQDLRELARDDPLIHSHLRFYELGHVCLGDMVRSLIHMLMDNNRELVQQVILLKLGQPNIIHCPDAHFEVHRPFDLQPSPN